MPDTTVAQQPAHTLHVGDALHVLNEVRGNSVDAVVTDPPYAIRRIPDAVFRGPAQPQPGCTNIECAAVDPCRSCVRTSQARMFSGAPMLGQQSQNWHAKETHSRGYADNDPRQFEAWCGLWLAECHRILKPGAHLVAFGGTRTWHRLAVAAEDAGFEIRDNLAWIYASGMPKSLNVARAIASSAHDMDHAAWEGWGTGLKPAFEPIVLARKRLNGTMADNLAEWGVGALNLQGVSSQADAQPGIQAKWPSNVHLDAEQAQRAFAQRGQDPNQFFWISKPAKSERVVVDGLAHPTVKPLDLMRRLVRLVTPSGGLVVDPFAGSGTTIEACLIEGMNVIGVERDPGYVPLIQQRVDRVSRAPGRVAAQDAERTQVALF